MGVTPTHVRYPWDLGIEVKTTALEDLSAKTRFLGNVVGEGRSSVSVLVFETLPMAVTLPNVDVSVREPCRLLDMPMISPWPQQANALKWNYINENQTAELLHRSSKLIATTAYEEPQWHVLVPTWGPI